jgi:hypothetical protein
MFSKYTNLKYQVTETTELESEILIDRAVFQIQNTDCKITIKTNSILAFKDDGRGLRTKGSFFKNIDEGIFEIDAFEKDKNFKLTYYVKLKVDLFFILGFILLGFFVDRFIFLIGLGFLIQMLIRIDSAKTTAKRMVYEIIKLE